MTDPRRCSLIDALRAVAVINMIVYHLCYDILNMTGGWQSFHDSAAVRIWELLGSFSFIIISGVCVNFSRHGFRRGAVVFACGAAVTVFTLLFFPDDVIWFGTLHFLGAAMLLTQALRRLLDRMEPLSGMAVFFILFMLCYGIPDGCIGIFSFPLIELPRTLYRYKWLSVLGFLSGDFSSADYYPLLRWIFLYLFSYQLWRLISRKKLDRFFYLRIPVLDFIGRHSLIIYLIHQPILYAVCYFIFDSV